VGRHHDRAAGRRTEVGRRRLGDGRQAVGVRGGA
jgi:hypothetical protein